jgi:hypothetical protein
MFAAAIFHSHEMFQSLAFKRRLSWFLGQDDEGIAHTFHFVKCLPRLPESTTTINRGRKGGQNERNIKLRSDKKEDCK